MTKDTQFGPQGFLPEHIDTLMGKTYAITGANCGTGFEAARLLLSKGANVVMLNRNAQKSEAAIDQLKDEYGSSAGISYVTLDLADLASVRTGAAQLIEQTVQLDALICNGAIAQIAKQELTTDGFESQLGVNHYGHFALCGLLFEHLEASKGRIVVVASEGYKLGRKTIQFDDMNWDKNYNPNNVYSQSKLAQMMFAYELQDKLAAANKTLKVYVCHPGSASTSLIRETANAPTRIAFKIMVKIGLTQTAQQGAYPAVMCATQDNLEQRAYYGPTGRWNWVGPVGQCKLEPHAIDKPTMSKLWTVSEQATLQKWPL